MPKGHWENVYKNLTPFGMGKSAHEALLVEGSADVKQAKSSGPFRVKLHRRRKSIR